MSGQIFIHSSSVNKLIHSQTHTQTHAGLFEEKQERKLRLVEG